MADRRRRANLQYNSALYTQICQARSYGLENADFSPKNPPLPLRGPNTRPIPPQSKPNPTKPPDLRNILTQLNLTYTGEIDGLRCSRAGERVDFSSCDNVWKKIPHRQMLEMSLMSSHRGLPLRYLSDDGLCAIVRGISETH